MPYYAPSHLLNPLVVIFECGYYGSVRYSTLPWLQYGTVYPQLHSVTVNLASNSVERQISHFYSAHLTPEALQMLLYKSDYDRYYCRYYCSKNTPLCSLCL